MNLRTGLVGTALAAVALAGCGSGSGGGATGVGPTHRANSASPVTGTVTVLAAASLKNVFASEATAFKTANPGVTVTFSFAGSQTLAAQLKEGSPADVFAAADETNIKKVDDTISSSTFAHNALTIVVSKGNPKKITSLSDLASSKVAVVLAGPSVPAGKYALQALAAAHLTVRPVTTTDNVTAVVTDVRLGQADAGISYVTDITGLAGVQGVPIPATQNVRATYPIAALKRAKNPAGAAAFIAFVESSAGQAILTKAGFAGR